MVVEVIPPKGTIDVHIQYSPSTQSCAVKGPINDKMVIFGVLEAAKEAVLEHHRKLREQRIQPI